MFTGTDFRTFCDGISFLATCVTTTDLLVVSAPGECVSRSGACVPGAVFDTSSKDIAGRDEGILDVGRPSLVDSKVLVVSDTDGGWSVRSIPLLPS